MKTDWSHLALFRVPHPLSRDMGDNTAGAFKVPLAPGDRRQVMFIIASNAEFTGWEHVSVHIQSKHKGKTTERTPTWLEMCRVKAMFWEDTETVVQLHVPKSDHINIHDHVLHLWRNVNQKITLPSGWLV